MPSDDEQQHAGDTTVSASAIERRQRAPSRCDGADAPQAGAWRRPPRAGARGLASSPRPQAAHPLADALDVASPRCAIGGDRRPCAMTTRRSLISNSSSSSSRHHQHRAARVAQLEELRADLSGRADIDAPGRLRDDQDLGPGVDLAADDELLQVAARQAARRRRAGRRALTLKRSMSRRAHARRSRPRIEPAAAAAPARGGSAGCCPRATCVGTAPRPSRSSGTKRRPSLRRRAGRRRGDVGAEQLDAARRGARASSPDSAASSSCWPLPETPAMPTISPACTSRSHVRRASTPNWSLPASESPRDLERDSPVAARRRAASCGGSAPIISRDRPRWFPARIDDAGHAPAAQHRARVAERPDLVELVADVEDAAAALGELPQRHEQLAPRPAA